MARRSSNESKTLARFRAALQARMDAVSPNMTIACRELRLPYQQTIDTLKGKATSITKMEDIVRASDIDIADLLAEGRAILEGQPAPTAPGTAPNDDCGAVRAENAALRAKMAEMEAENKRLTADLLASKDETIAALKGASNQDAPMATYPARAGSARTTRTE